MRSCDGCGKSDDGPRHVIGTLDGSLQQVKHFACCAEAGCPDGSCDKIMAEAGSGGSRSGIQ